MNLETYTLHGYAALRIAKRDGVTLLYKGTPVLPKQFVGYDCDSLRAVVTPHGWLEFYADGWAEIDPSHKYLTNRSISDYFRDGRYLGPDENGIEPRWRDAGL